MASMKAVILSECPDIQIIDVDHSIPRHSIRSGAFIMFSSVPYFPEGSIHVGVIDPGVGTDRKCLLIECDKGFLIGPDNGLLYPTAQALGLKKIYEIDIEKFGKISNVFHGRDVFAKTAAKVAKYEFLDFCKETKDMTDLSLKYFEKRDVWYEVLVNHIDRFGNIALSIPYEMISSESVIMKVKGRKYYARVVSTYGELDSGEIGVLDSSVGFAEIACSGKSAASILKLSVDDKVCLNF